MAVDDDKQVKILDLNAWIESFSAFMADETLKVLRANCAKRGPDVSRALCIHFLARVLSSTVLDTLHERMENPQSEAEALRFNQKQFAELKIQVQDAVALSFQTAMSHYTGRQVEYYCTIKPVPDPVNSTVN